MSRLEVDVPNGICGDWRIESFSVSEDSRVRIVRADALNYRPPVGEQFDAVWHDIWDYITAENLPEMHRLHRKYGRRAGWQGSWARDYCERGW